MEPVSHFFLSDRLKLQLWDYGQDGKPALVLVHGGLDHARSWDWVAQVLCQKYHVYVLDLSALLDIIHEFPIRLVGHSLGGIIVLHYAGIYPDRVSKVVSIEGIGLPATHRVHAPAPQRLRGWIENVRGLEKRTPHSYPDLQSAMARMKEANPRLSDEVARHLTLHGTNWVGDGSLVWKFDNYVRAFSPYGHSITDASDVFAQISAPTLLFWGLESFAPVPENDPRVKAIKNRRLIPVAKAGHWVHHDQLDLFLKETSAFLIE